MSKRKHRHNVLIWLNSTYLSTTLRTPFYAILFGVCLMQMAISPAIAQVCYSDARDAYEHLIAREQRQVNEAQAIIDEAWVNINTASEAQLTTLKGIGSKKAQEIILYRDMFGKFTSVDDLTEVNGIGERTVEKNRHRLRID